MDRIEAIFETIGAIDCMNYSRNTALADVDQNDDHVFAGVYMKLGQWSQESHISIW